MQSRIEWRLQLIESDIDPAPANQYLLDADEFTIGRGPGNTLQLNHATVSGDHAVLRRTADGWEVTDRRSKNGTKVNGRELSREESVHLQPGDIIDIAAVCRLRIDYAGEESELSASMEATHAGDVQAADATNRNRSDVPVDTLHTDTGAQMPEPPKPPRPPHFPEHTQPPHFGEVPPGLQLRSLRLLPYLPGEYHVYNNGSDLPTATTPFLSRFLALFESILLPIEGSIDGFDLLLETATAPPEFLDWIIGWFGFGCDENWTEGAQRTLLAEAHKLFAWRGTKKALHRMLVIYTGLPEDAIQIQDHGPDIAPHTFRVSIADLPSRTDINTLHAIISLHQPAQAAYTLHSDNE
ncbi:MAG: FHA domain-containing protein [Caldilineaceae bacterium]|nr:FHA domain-containing protein [Caldilineaceae bacterium]